MRKASGALSGAGEYAGAGSSQAANRHGGNGDSSSAKERVIGRVLLVLFGYCSFQAPAKALYILANAAEGCASL